MSKLWMRAPARCLDCDHSVGPTGRHVIRAGRVWCRDCRAFHVHSMRFRYQGTWIADDTDRPATMVMP